MVSPGGYREGATPVPIPNTEVKPLIADGTAWGTVWESRTLPGQEIINKNPELYCGVFYCVLLILG
jgi:hypothetical protein